MVEVQGVEPAAELPKELDAKLAHIDAVSKNARGTWLSLIAALLFSAITVAGVRDQDYFTYGSALVLPVIGVSVPIKSFFYAGPLIVLGLYTYLHLYLIKLWRALSSIDAQPAKGVWLDDLVFPWLISDAAIFLKPGAPKRPFRWLTQLVSFSFLWAAAPLILLLFWIRSFPPHDGWLTAWVGTMVALALLGGSASLLIWHRLLRNERELADNAVLSGQIKPSILVWVIVSGALLFEGWARSTGGVQTENLVLGGADHIYRSQLYRAEIVERPKDWLPYLEALKEFKAQYSGVRRKDLDEADQIDESSIFAAETAFRKQRMNLLSSLRANDFPDVDLNSANLREAFLPGIDLRRANLRAIDLTSATVEGADLTRANLYRANLTEANLAQADLTEANLTGVNLTRADLHWADLIRVNLTKADLTEASMTEMALTVSDLTGANLTKAALIGSVLTGSDLTEAVLIGADVYRANLTEVNLTRADLTGADLTEANLYGVNLTGADLTGVDLTGASLVSADLSVNDYVTQGQINSAYGDRSTKLPEHLDRPQHWPEEVLLSQDVFERWLAWREGKDK